MFLTATASLMLLTPAQAALIDFSNPLPYTGQPTTGTAASDGSSLTLTGNIWTAFAFDTPFSVKENSVLSFNYRSDELPEIAAIGFDNDTQFNYSLDAKNAVKFAGTQGPNWPEYILAPKYTEGSGFASYSILLTDFLNLGDTFSYLVFLNDDDAVFSAGGDGSSFSVFSDVSVSPTPIPGAIWLLGSGMLGLAGVRRRFSRA